MLIRKIAEKCKPLEDERKSILEQMEELDESIKKVDVKIKTQTASKKRERMDQIQRAKSTEKKSMENLKMLQKKKNDLDKKIEGMNKRNSKLRNDIERVSHEKGLQDDGSEDEDIEPRKILTPNSGNSKRKLAVAAKKDVYDFNKISDDGDIASSSTPSKPPSTPRNSGTLPSISSSSRFGRKPGLSSLMSAAPKVDGKDKATEKKEEFNEDDILQLTSTSQ